ncbi:uroporphyrinogen-III C-methyltransferase [Macrococcus sp. DPC7161]|uniref:uroporphyrinogen-III C-methyltransferase n=1 Tax=Macrococcus sp. DPC7161 TaxID=2507060 RepID=UPI00100B31A6|nr:uroporphyrinogen-III C-methyltransferase [Macrococcus sp. DPC7161]
MGRIGKVYFIGAGPGDPGLCSYKGLRKIKQADVIIYDRLVNKMLLQLSKQDAKLIYVGKNPDVNYIKQHEINSLIYEYAKEGHIVARLKGGDPGIFGRLSEEIDTLKSEIPFEVIPGITSASAASLYAGFPLTDRQYSPHVTFATGHLQKDSVREIDFQALAKGGTLALYMGMKELPNIVNILSEENEATLPVAVIGNGTYGYQKTVTGDLSNIVALVTEADIKHPAMIIVGDVVKCRKNESWFEQMPDHNRKILIVNDEKSDVESVLEMYDDGGYYYLIDGLNDAYHVQKYIEIHQTQLHEIQFDEIRFTSENAKYLFQKTFHL